MHFSCSFKRILKCITLPAIINSLMECYTMQLYDKIKFPYKLLTYSHAQHSNSIMHHYECVALCKDIGLQRGRFCTRSVASCVPKIQQRQVIMNALHPSCARPPRWSPPVLWRRFKAGLASICILIYSCKMPKESEKTGLNDG